MNTLPYPIIIKLIEEWPGLIFVNKHIYNIYKKYMKNKEYVTVEHYFNPCIKTFNKMCKNGKYIQIPGKQFDYNFGLFSACLGGHLNIVKLMIEKGAERKNMGLRYACKGGHLNIVKFMIEIGANDWDLGLITACRGGHLNIVNLMIEKGASDWDWGLAYACEVGNLDIINLMIKKGADDWNEGLAYACNAGNLDIVNLMIEKGATKCYNCDSHDF